MKIWLPYVRGGSGTDVFTHTLGQTLQDFGVEVEISAFAHSWQYFPWRLKAIQEPKGTDIIVTNTWNGFAFSRENIPLITIEHHCIFDPAYKVFRSPLQAVFHEGLVKYFELSSIAKADAVVAVSQYTANSVRKALGVKKPYVLYNAIDTDFFNPAPETERPEKQITKLLFVGNLIHRKGADLLPKIMDGLGSDFELHYTKGLRTSEPFTKMPNMIPLGRLSHEELRQAYRDADILLFPTRFEGFGYAVAEAMACGTPVVASDCSSMPELINNNVTGKLCPVEDVGAFIQAVKEISVDKIKLNEMGNKASEAINERFSLEKMSKEYIRVFEKMLNLVSK